MSSRPLTSAALGAAVIGLTLVSGTGTASATPAGTCPTGWELGSYYEDPWGNWGVSTSYVTIHEAKAADKNNNYHFCFDVNNGGKARVRDDNAGSGSTS